MDGEAFIDALQKLGATQVQLAIDLGVSRRTVQYWCAKGPPRRIAMLIQALLRERALAPNIESDQAKTLRQARSVVRAELSSLSGTPDAH